MHARGRVVCRPYALTLRVTLLLIPSVVMTSSRKQSDKKRRDIMMTLKDALRVHADIRC
jgi:hypothetical protein